MAQKILRRRKRPTKAKDVLPQNITVAMDVATKRLQRASGVLTAIVFLAEEGADIDLAPCAICARDQIDRAIEGLAPLIKQGGVS